MRKGSDKASVKTGDAPAATHAHQVLGMRLKSLRLARRLSLRELAEATGTSASFISQLERGLTGASTASLNQMASALGVSVAMLFEESTAQDHGVLRRSERPSLPPSDGCRKMLLSRPPHPSHPARPATMYRRWSPIWARRDRPFARRAARLSLLPDPRR